MVMSQMYIFLFTILFPSMVSCLPVSNLEEVPLSTSDIQTIKELDNKESSIPTISDGRNCILSPAKSLSASSTRCTWRKEKKCDKVPTSVQIPVFSPWCVGEGQGVHVSDCKVITRTEPIVHTVKICSNKGKKECSGPCYNCPTFCKPSKQTWCENSHEVKTVAKISSQCKEGTEGRACQKINKRIENDVVEEVENCYQKNVEEMCATINCKFVNITEDCQEKETTMLVQLTERSCTICEPYLSQKTELREECEENLSDNCGTEPLEKPWRKFCSEKDEGVEQLLLSDDNNLFKNGQETFRSVERGDDRVLIDDILDKSLTPVNDLVFETLRRINIEDLDKENPVVIIPNSPLLIPTENPDPPFSRADIMEKELIKLGDLEEKLLTEELGLLKSRNSQPTTINLNVKYEYVNRSSSTPRSTTKQSVYFDPLLQLIDTQIEPVVIDSDKTLALTPRHRENDIKPNPLSATSASQPLISDTVIKATNKTLVTTTTSIDKKTHLTTINIETNKVRKFQFHSASVTTTKPTTITSIGSTESSEKGIATTEISRVPKKLSAAEYFKLCFSSGTGCDFSINKNGVESTPESIINPTTTQKPKPTTTTRSSKEVIEERLKARVRLCFFSGICNDEEALTASTQQTTTTTTTTSKPRVNKQNRRTSSLMEDRIRQRAYLCFSEGKCS